MQITVSLPNNKVQDPRSHIDKVSLAPNVSELS